ncbi:hypothetical protein BEL04_14870 [Mucilaginibacter sp. PPCGB 2223]|nr:hypothetical protein BEL04_14870 [Mucilaginibacter sp. PPCGB 2223]
MFSCNKAINIGLLWDLSRIFGKFTFGAGSAMPEAGSLKSGKISYNFPPVLLRVIARHEDNRAIAGSWIPIKNKLSIHNLCIRRSDWVHRLS